MEQVTMGEYIIDMLTTVFEYVSGWFWMVLAKSNMVLIYLGLVAAAFSVRLLIGPIVGHGSDHVSTSIKNRRKGDT